MSKQQIPDHNVHPVYRPDIDGLRAIAILSVVIFHAFPLGLPGGFIGVDVFFVISGFLISTIIFRSLQRGDFSFTEFYAHRIKRIFPALILVLVTCYVLGWFVLLPDEFKQLGKHIAAGAGFVQNFILFSEIGYFDTAAELKPLLHIWSLAIEEQFYLVYPVLIFAAWRLGFNIFTLAVLLFFISFGLNVAGVLKNTTSTFFMPQTRFWELLVGSYLAYLQFFKRMKFATWMQRWVFHPVLFSHPPAAEKRLAILNNAISIVGLSIIIGSVFFVTKSKPFPGWWATLPVLAAFFLILAGPDTIVNRFVLANRFMVFVGLISYPLYLWHWPLLSFARIIEADIPSQSIRGGAVIISVTLAWLTYLFIEKPIRYGAQTWRKTAMLAATLVVCGYVGYNAFERNGLEFRIKNLKGFSKVLEAAGEWEYPGKLAFENISDVQYFVRYSQKNAITLFVGDSNVEQYWPRIERLIEDDPVHTNGAIFKTGGGCTAIPNLPFGADHKHCLPLTDDAMKIIEKKPEIDTVVIGGQWSGLGWNTTDKYDVGTKNYTKALGDLGVYIKKIKMSGKRVFLILNIPIGPKLDPKYIVHRDLKDFPKVFSLRDGGEAMAELERKMGRLQADLEQVGISAGASIIKPMNFLCSVNCRGTDQNNSPIYKDGAHLRPTYVRDHAEFIDKTVH